MVEIEWGNAVKNTMVIDGCKAVVTYDPEIEMFRGEFIDLNGGADFYANDIEGLKKEGATSLRIFLDMCKEDGVAPRKSFSGRFNLRISPNLHAQIVTAATATGKSLNQWITETLDREVHA